MISDLYVLEWSQRGNVFHVRRLVEVLQENRHLYASNSAASDDSRPLIVGTQSECMSAAEASAQTLAGRETRKAA